MCIRDSNRDNIVGKHISVLYNGIQENFEVVGVIKTGSGLLSNIIGDYIPCLLYTSDGSETTAKQVCSD